MLQRSSKRARTTTLCVVTKKATGRLTTDLHVGEVIHLQHFRGIFGDGGPCLAMALPPQQFPPPIPPTSPVAPPSYVLLLSAAHP